jgi:hypothetical protein
VRFRWRNSWGADSNLANAAGLARLYLNSRDNIGAYQHIFRVTPRGQAASHS